MKYCEKCGQIIKPGYIFCTSCGTKQKNHSNRNADVPNYIISKYINLTVKGIYKNILEITPSGLHMYRNSIVFPEYDKIIHYSEIKRIEYRKPTMLHNGYLSIISKNGGISGLTPPYSSHDAQLLSKDPNTIFCRRSSKELLDKIYNAINDICYQLEEPDLKNTQYSKISDDYTDQYYNYQNSEIVHSIDGMNGHEFEYFCAELLRNTGFTDVSVTPGSGDQGVDILAQKDGIKYAIQCKNYSSKLGNTPVQEVNSGKIYYHCHVAVVMTNSYFTSGAIQLANATGVLLWNRDRVLEMMKNTGLLFENECPTADTVLDDKIEEESIVIDEGEDDNVDSITNEIESFIVENETDVNTDCEIINPETKEDEDSLQNNKNEKQSDSASSNIGINSLIRKESLEELQFVKNTICAPEQENENKSSKQLRKGMLAWMIIFLVLTFPCAFSFFFMLTIEGLFVSEFMGIACLFLILSIMFFILAKSPKSNPYILGNSKGLKKVLFIVICILLAFTICILSFDIEKIDSTDLQSASVNQEETTTIIEESSSSSN